MAICHPWKNQEKIDLQWQHHNNKSDLCKGSFQIPKSQTTTNNQRTTTKLNHLILECAPSPPPPPQKKRKTYKNRESYKNGTHCSFLWHCLVITLGLYLCGPEIRLRVISDPMIKILDPVWAKIMLHNFARNCSSQGSKTQRLYLQIKGIVVVKYMTELHKQYGTQQLCLANPRSFTTWACLWGMGRRGCGPWLFCFVRPSL